MLHSSVSAGINFVHSTDKELNLLYSNIEHIGHIQFVTTRLYINTHIHTHTQSDYKHAYIYSADSLVILHTDPVHVFTKLMQIHF